MPLNFNILPVSEFSKKKYIKDFYVESFAFISHLLKLVIFHQRCVILKYVYPAKRALASRKTNKISFHTWKPPVKVFHPSLSKLVRLAEAKLVVNAIRVSCPNSRAPPNETRTNVSEERSSGSCEFQR